ncbi:UNKNOWN [Stylonychia lemnae]|uniref:Uncharacterized protein n=1 Tax=Stylonychia lemnae TaxID=5949 RepID=A0A078A483_STYLE|nr:UNKNOWN [Stylonychia lemnae]|eukprot:CDW75564.1 UNKNOWN [Stylonychia lemnae]
MKVKVSRNNLINLSKSIHQRHHTQVLSNQYATNEDDFLNNIPDEICYQNTACNYKLTTIPTQIVQKSYVEECEMSQTSIKDEPRSIRNNKTGISPGRLTSRVMKATPVNLMRLFDNSDNYQQLLQDDFDSSRALLNSSTIKDLLKSDFSKGLHQQKLRTGSQSPYSARVNNIKSQYSQPRIKNRQMPQTKINLTRYTIQQHQKPTPRNSKQDQSQNQDHHRINKQTQQQLGQTMLTQSQIGNAVTEQLAKADEGRKTFTGISKTRIQQARNKLIKQQQDARRQEIPLELKLLKYNQTIMAQTQRGGKADNNANSFQMVTSRSQDKSGSITPTRAMGVDQRARSRNIVERYLNINKSQHSLQENNHRFQQNQTVAIQSNKTRTFNNNNDLNIKQSIQVDLNDTDLEDSDSDTIDEIDVNDIEEQNNLVRSKYSPKKYPRNPSRSPSRLFRDNMTCRTDRSANHTQNNSKKRPAVDEPQTQQRNSIIEFDARETNSNSEVHTFKREKKQNRQSHTNYIVLPSRTQNKQSP